MGSVETVETVEVVQMVLVSWYRGWWVGADIFPGRLYPLGGSGRCGRYL